MKNLLTVGVLHQREMSVVGQEDQQKVVVCPAI